MNTTADNECDTDADMCCLGKNFIVLNSSFWTADGYAYETSIQPLENVPIITGATGAYNDVESGRTFILVFHESLYYGERLDHSLINPNQLRAYGISFWDNPYNPAHTLSIEVHPAISIPLRTFGMKAGFRTRVPTPDELRDCEHVQVTSLQPWKPFEIVMVQETGQGGKTSLWKRRYHSCQSAVEHHLNTRIQIPIKRYSMRLTRLLYSWRNA